MIFSDFSSYTKKLSLSPIVQVRLTCEHMFVTFRHNLTASRSHEKKTLTDDFSASFVVSSTWENEKWKTFLIVEMCQSSTVASRIIALTAHQMLIRRRRQTDGKWEMWKIREWMNRKFRKIAKGKKVCHKTSDSLVSFGCRITFIPEIQFNFKWNSILVGTSDSEKLVYFFYVHLQRSMAKAKEFFFLDSLKVRWSRCWSVENCVRWFSVVWFKSSTFLIAWLKIWRKRLKKTFFSFLITESLKH